MQSTVLAQALALCWSQSLQLSRGQWFCPCSTGRALKSPACWKVWLSIGILEYHRHVSINIDMNCINWSCLKVASLVFFSWTGFWPHKQLLRRALFPVPVAMSLVLLHCYLTPAILLPQLHHEASIINLLETVFFYKVRDSFSSSGKPLGVEDCAH